VPSVVALVDAEAGYVIDDVDAIEDGPFPFIADMLALLAAPPFRKTEAGLAEKGVSRGRAVQMLRMFASQALTRGEAEIERFWGRRR
jgi:hypothetical protein